MIKDVIVNITRQTSPLSTAGFGLPLILATDKNNEYTEYSELADVVADYATATSAYTMASRLFSQNPRPEKIAILGVSYTAIAMARATLTTTIVAANSNLKYTSKVAGLAGTYIQIKYTDPATTTEATTAAVTGTGTSADPYIINVTLSYAGSAITAKASDVKTAIEGATAAAALVKVEYATDNDGTGLVTALAATALAGGVNGSSAAVLVTALNTLINTQNDWYYLLCDQHGYNEIVALSAWTATQKKKYFAVTKDDNMIDFETINSENTILIYTDKDTEYPDAAWVGVGAPTTPGEITWKFKTLVGISAATVSDSRVLELHSHHVNTYVKKFGVLQTSAGLTTLSPSEYIDTLIGQDWVETNITEQVSLELFSLPKIPYDNTGIAIVLSTVLKVLKQAWVNGIIATDENGNGMYSASAPNRKDISSTDRATRHLPDVKFTYTVAGAIEDITINGVVTV